MKYIAYYRVSTIKQGQSGLGIDAQKAAIKNYIGQETLHAEYIDVESGKNNDRPELIKAIDHSRKENAILLIAKLDRLSRDVNFISGLMKSEISFVACDQPNANKFTLHIFAALAEQERDLISERTKAALQALKRRGKKLGSPQNLTDEARQKGVERLKIKAKINPNNQRAASLIMSLREKGLSFNAISKELNKNGFMTSQGKKFQAIQVQRLVS